MNAGQLTALIICIVIIAAIVAGAGFVLGSMFYVEIMPAEWAVP